MAGFRDTDGNRGLSIASLETPRTAGFRHGMSPTGLIGRRLANVYDVASDVPRDMGRILRNLDVKSGRNR